jgi:broad specificity phosphatase PhoE
VSTLFLIRHGQASFGAADYDVLSPLGIQQAQRLGAHLVTTPIDAIYAGPRKRQQDTARHLVGSLRAAGGRCTEPVTVEDLDEYPAEVIFRQALPRLAESDPEAQAILGGEPDVRLVTRVFERAMRSWAARQIPVDEEHSFELFATRVRRALERIMEAEGRRRTVAVVTSAGPVSISLQMGLELSDEMALKMSWVVANSSVTEYKYRADELTLVGFNRVSHLEPAHITYR